MLLYDFHESNQDFFGDTQNLREYFDFIYMMKNPDKALLKQATKRHYRYKARLFFTNDELEVIDEECSTKTELEECQNTMKNIKRKLSGIFRQL